MNPAEQQRFKSRCDTFLPSVKRHGLPDQTFESYSHTLRRVASHLRRCPDDLTPAERKAISHSCRNTTHGDQFKLISQAWLNQEERWFSIITDSPFLAISCICK